MCVCVCVAGGGRQGGGLHVQVYCIDVKHSFLCHMAVCACRVPAFKGKYAAVAGKLEDLLRDAQTQGKANRAVFDGAIASLVFHSFIEREKKGAKSVGTNRKKEDESRTGGANIC